MKNLCLVITTICLLFIVQESHSQDLDPRAYIWLPVNVSFISAGYAYSHGGVLADASLPLTDVSATVNSSPLAAGYMFGLFGKTAQFSAALPFVWANASGMIEEQSSSTSRSGLGDMRMRLSLLLHGAPAVTPAEYAKAKHRTILGTSLSVIAPTGQYFPDKLINIGNSRWTFKPEVALSHPIGSRWLLDLYAGVLLFTKTYSFYPGNSVRCQDPLAAFQGHFSYNINPRTWAAVDVTYYGGGTSSVDGVDLHNRQSNSRVGATMVLPVGKRNSVKFAYSRGAIIAWGADFTSLSVGWQSSFYMGPKKSPAE